MASKTDDKGFVEKTARRLRELFYGKKAYKGKFKGKGKGAKKKGDTARTHAIKKQLRSAITEEEIARFKKTTNIHKKMKMFDSAYKEKK
jgi:hypothetical protein